MDALEVFGLSLRLLGSAMILSLAYHLFADPFCSGDRTSAELRTLAASRLFRTSKVLAFFGVVACLSQGYGLLFRWIPESWSYTGDDGSPVSIRGALSGLMAIISAIVVSMKWNARPQRASDSQGRDVKGLVL